MSAKHKASFFSNRQNRLKLVTGALFASVAIAGSAVLATSNAIAAPTPVSLSCPAGTVDLNVTGKIVCEVTYTSTPGAAFSFPSYVHSAEALIVGAGGTSVGGYAGGGGEVKVVSLDTATDAQITVGTSNTGYGTSNVTQGTSSHNADAGADGYDGNGAAPDPVPGQSGNGNAGSFFQTGVGAGGGAGTVGGFGAVDQADPLSLFGGEGVQPADLVSSTSLFANDTTCYGGGGSAWSSSYLTYVSGSKFYYSAGLSQGGQPTNVYCAGGYATNPIYNSAANLDGANLLISRNTVVQNGVTYVYHGSNSIPDYIANGVSHVDPTQNSGGGAGAYFSQTSTLPGANGYVSIRFQLLRDIYVVPKDKTKTYGDAAPTYDYDLCTDAACTGGPIVGPAGMTDPTCTSDYVASSSTTGSVPNSPRSITCSGGSMTGYNFITTPTATLTIVKANADCVVDPYDVTYDGTAQTDSGTCTGVNGEDLSGDLTVADSNTNAGEYKGESWNFTDTTGNYNDQNGKVDNYIRQANADCSVTPYDEVYDGTEYADTGSCTGVNGEDLSSDLTVAPGHTNAGTYNAEPWSFTSTSGNYKSQNGSVNNRIRKAVANCTVNEYHVTYNGNQHTDTGSCTGVGGATLSGLTVPTGHTNAGTYNGEPWSFVDASGNYENQNGTVDNSIAKADAVCTVGEYHVTYDGNEHVDQGSCLDINGNPLSGLVVAPGHTNAGTYDAEPWTFTDVTGNYNDDNGISNNSIDKADVTCVVTPYDVVFDNNSHIDTGVCTGVGGEDVSAGLTVSPANTAVGNYLAEGWSFVDGTGNYNSKSGTVDNYIRKIPTNVNNTSGPNTLNPGTPLNLSYTGVPVLCTSSVTYTLDVNPLTGATGTYVLTGPTVDTTGWLPGNYVITATYTEDPNCLGSNNNTNLTVNNPVVPPVVDPCGTEAEIEHYALTHEEDGCEHHESGDNHDSYDPNHESGDGSRHEGDVRWEQKDCWKFTGTSTGYARAEGRNVRVSAVGYLSYWDKASKSWVLATNGKVTFNATYLSANANSKSQVTLSSFFGVSVEGAKKAGAPTLPSFTASNAPRSSFKFN